MDPRFRHVFALTILCCICAIILICTHLHFAHQYSKNAFLIILMIASPFALVFDVVGFLKDERWVLRLSTSWKNAFPKRNENQKENARTAWLLYVACYLFCCAFYAFLLLRVMKLFKDSEFRSVILISLLLVMVIFAMLFYAFGFLRYVKSWIRTSHQVFVGEGERVDFFDSKNNSHIYFNKFAILFGIVFAPLILFEIIALPFLPILQQISFIRFGIAIAIFSLIISLLNTISTLGQCFLWIFNKKEELFSTQLKSMEVIYNYFKTYANIMIILAMFIYILTCNAMFVLIP